eukprot:Blabericola_migrator_1__11338@NODE_66_length_15680_cov_202_244988_g59_i0_p5_GENE_NODE_66_length_15680_cov_202_244988_g59_i0NODE_66_length_15680_cov_202_244988_g59_i0_p5_ORF_typecomplete_len435_score59_07MFS_1/PF07690_16/2_5e09MFS_1/PF07690_16/1_6e13MFS_4/PF06779_14/3_6e09MFS_2/PF13347_6/49MFS_2/PF13347_6/1_9e07MFS_3/PF05977_13/0_023Sugar_tr/PF00083_24/6_4e02Sugar_tr/PF00083_24/0_22Sugar_tr/PF00083_24/1_6_NODE_66_length_15680_cov_202_244988_g59_i01421615520
MLPTSSTSFADSYNVRQELKVARICNLLLFYIMGIAIGTFVAGVPGLKKGFALTSGQLGLAIMCSGIASLCMALPAGRMVDMMGVRFMASYSGVFGPIAYSLLPTVAAWGWGPFFPLFFVNIASAGGFISCNSRAAELERFWEKPIMSSFHAAYSLGGLSGSVMYSFLLSHGFDWSWAHPILFLSTMLLNLMVLPFMDEGLEEARRRHNGDAVLGTKVPCAYTPTPVILLFGGAAIIGYLTEGAIGDWFAIYLQEYDHCPYRFAPLGYSCYTAAMCIFRSVGDKLCHKFGRRTIYRTSAILIFFAITIFLSVKLPQLGMLCCVLMGIGMANIEPILISNVGRHAVENPGMAIASVTSMGNAGQLSGPGIIGLLAERWGLREALHLLQVGAVFLVIASVRISDGEEVKRASIVEAFSGSAEALLTADRRPNEGIV